MATPRPPMPAQPVSPTSTYTQALYACVAYLYARDAAAVAPAPAPVAAFAWKPGAAPYAIVLDASASTGDVLAYAWSLGKYPDDATTGKVATAVYPHDGLRTVTLVVTDTQGRTATTTKIVTVPITAPVVVATDPVVAGGTFGGAAFTVTVPRTTP